MSRVVIRREILAIPELRTTTLHVETKVLKVS